MPSTSFCFDEKVRAMMRDRRQETQINFVWTRIVHGNVIKLILVISGLACYLKTEGTYRSNFVAKIQRKLFDLASWETAWNEKNYNFGITWRTSCVARNSFPPFSFVDGKYIRKKIPVTRWLCWRCCEIGVSKRLRWKKCAAPISTYWCFDWLIWPQSRQKVICQSAKGIAHSINYTPPRTHTNASETLCTAHRLSYSLKYIMYCSGISNQQ